MLTVIHPLSEKKKEKNMNEQRLSSKKKGRAREKKLEAPIRLIRLISLSSLPHDPLLASHSRELTQWQVVEK